MATRCGIMLARVLDDKLLARFPEWVIVQPKLDGDRCRAVPAPEGYMLLSSQGTRRDFAVPHIKLALDALGNQVWGVDPRNWQILDGELYVHGVSHQKIRSVVSRTENLHVDFAKIRYHVFDTISSEIQMKRSERLMKIEALAHAFDALRIVPTFRTPNTKAKILEAMDLFLEQGYEGVIVRNPYGDYKDCGPKGARRSNDLLKLKPVQSGEGLCIDLLEAISIDGEPKGMLGAFLVKSVLNGKEQVFKVSAGKLVHAERLMLWQNQRQAGDVQIIVHYRYLTLTDDGLPREPVCTHVEVQ